MIVLWEGPWKRKVEVWCHRARGIFLEGLRTGGFVNVHSSEQNGPGAY